MLLWLGALIHLAGQKSEVLAFKFAAESKLLTIRKPGVNMANDFTLTLN